MKKVIVSLDDRYRTTAAARQHRWYSDLPPDDGRDTAPNPEEMLLGALGSCMAQTARLYAQRKGWQVDNIEIRLELERFNGSDYDPYQGDALFVHEIREHIIIEGPLSDDQINRIRNIMGKCPVRRLLINPVYIEDLEREPEQPLG